jgi:hypothetical protein
MAREYQWLTKKYGMVRIVREADGWYTYLDRRKWDGPFKVPHSAAEQLVDHEIAFPEGVGSGNSSWLGIPDKLSEWKKL